MIQASGQQDVAVVDKYPGTASAIKITLGEAIATEAPKTTLEWSAI